MHHPIRKFKKHWKQAKTLKAPNAEFCSLVTVSKAGQASVRTLVLREVTEDSFVVFINNTSPKWDQFQQSKQYEILVFWPSLMRQYRIQGTIFSEIDPKVMHRNWSKKPYASKILDLYYIRYQPQSSLISSREKFLEEIELLKQEYPHSKTIPFPESAKGVAFKAESIEEWCESVEDRLHERYLYTLDGDQWLQHILIP